MFGDNSVLMEISAELDRINAEMRKTTDPAKLESLRKDKAILKDEYRTEVVFLYGM